MTSLLHAFERSFVGYARWVGGEVRHVSLHSYFWLLVGVSATVALLEVVRPWRKDQPFLRRDFFLDLFYVFFNFFGFGLLGYAALSDVSATLASRALASIGLSSLALVDATGWPWLAQLALYFVARDFVEYFIHRLLHRVPFLWRLHEVHHSARVMGFAAHLRYHPFETVVYRTLESVPMALLGFSVTDFFLVHAFALTIGHLNHANVRIPLGPLKYLFNSAEMHLLHHAERIPVPTGVNFGLTLSVWDWLFGTAWDPDSERSHVALGFEGVDRFPRTFLGQLVEPFRTRSAPGAPSVEAPSSGRGPEDA